MMSQMAGKISFHHKLKCCSMTTNKIENYSGMASAVGTCAERPGGKGKLRKDTQECFAPETAFGRRNVLLSGQSVLL